MFNKICFQILSLLRSSTVQGPAYRAVVAVAEGMHTRRSDMTNELVTKSLLEPLLKCLESTGRGVTVFCFTVFHCEIRYRIAQTVLCNVIDTRCESLRQKPMPEKITFLSHF